jgi:hypothetical protein
MNIFKKIKLFFDDFKQKRRLKKKLKELRKRDPFIYK